MKRLILAALAAAALSASCVGAFGLSGNGKVVDDERAVGGFSAIDVSGSADVRVHKAARARVVVTADSNLQEYFDASVLGSKLRLGWKPMTLVTRVTKLVVDVYLPELEGVELSGSCGMVIEDDFSGDSLYMNLSGSGSVSAASLRYGELSMEISGSGRVEAAGTLAMVRADLSGSGGLRLEGKGDEMTLSVSGSGSAETGKFACARVKAGISGSGDVSVFATETLDASMSGSGSVSYRGNPRINSKSSGSGSMRSLD